MLTDSTFVPYWLHRYYGVVKHVWINNLISVYLCDPSVQKKHLAFKGFHNFIYIFFLPTN